jgi:hypothetical protein
LLVITDGVRDAQGQRITAAHFHDDLARGQHEYDRDLRDGVHRQRDRVVAATLFTTQSITADLQKIARQVKHSTPAPVDFMIGNGGATRAVFPTATLAGIRFDRQTTTAPVTPCVPSPTNPCFVPTSALGVVPGSVAAVAYGRYASPDYETAGKEIPRPRAATD